MISGRSGSFAKGEGQIIASINKSFKMGMVCILYGEISEGSDPKSPPPLPLDPPLVIEVANVDSTDTDVDSLMNSAN